MHLLQYVLTKINAVTTDISQQSVVTEQYNEKYGKQLSL